MVWLGLILAMIWAQSVQGWSEWGFRITVLSSLGANLVVGFLAGTRRRLASGRCSRWLGQLAKFCLWFACQVGEAATTNAIGSLSLCGSDASEEEKQVVAFWATFLLLHLGGPDNLTAYALEDNKISSRKCVELIYRIVVVIYAIYNNTNRRGGGRSWALLPAASGVMLLAGAVRYIETVVALRKANLDTMQEDASSSSSKEADVHKMCLLECRIKCTKRQGRWLRDGAALLLAQDLFPIWRHALVDSSVNPTSKRQKASELILSKSSDERERDWDWEGMCKVAEMELSLIYEFLYTKAILAHTWCYYLIRLLSPLFTATAAFLFCFWLQLQPDRQQQQQQGVRSSYGWITYALLGITLVMDVAWLLRALGSTWAYAYLKEQAPAWLRHQKRLHRIVVRLDPLRLLFCRDPVSHRRWSGTIGRYNLLDECTAAATATATTCQCPCPCPELWPWSKAGDDKPKEMRYLSKLPQCVKKMVFERVTVILQEAIKKEDGGEKKKEDGEENKNKYTRVDIRTKWGHKALSRAVDEGKIKSPTSGETDNDKIKSPTSGESEDRIISFGNEFEEDVLLWHIATCMVLPYRQKRKYARAIEVLSEYMMFLVAVRRQMLPGLVLHSQLKVTRGTLVETWEKYSEGLKVNNKEKLAFILRCVAIVGPATEVTDPIIEKSEATRLLLDAAKLFFYLSGEERPRDLESLAARWPPPQIEDENRLELIFNVWVDKLVYAAVRCSRETHAKQLSAGGDLTTVLWMLIQHAGPFCIGEEAPDIHFPRHAPRDKADEKAKLPQMDVPPPPPPPPPRLPPHGLPPLPPAPDQPLPWPWAPPMYYPVCPPCYDPSWRPVCPCCPQCPRQHEEPEDEPEEAREDEHEDSSSDEESEE